MSTTAASAIAILVSGVVLFFIGLQVGMTHAEQAPIPACVEEDGSGGPIPCYWDGKTRGNGEGSSYIITE